MNAACRFDRDSDTYLTRAHKPSCVRNDCPGCQPCTHDDDGHPIRHCTGRKGCISHLATGERKTCARCISNTRSNLIAIENGAAMMLPQAIVDGIDSEAANLAGPAAHPGAEKARRHWDRLQAARIEDPRDRQRALEEIPEDDPHHPVAVLGRWATKLRKHYGQPTSLAPTLSRSRAYLDGILTRVAQDPELDFFRFAAEVSTCRSHLENVRHDSRAPERGATCFLCDVPAPKLERRFGHWCTREDCERQHDATGARDTWVCPRNGTHWWSEAEYRLRVGWDALDHAEKLTASQLRDAHDINPVTLRQWVKRGKVHQRGRDGSGRILYDVDEAIAARDANPTREKAHA